MTGYKMVEFDFDPDNNDGQGTLPGKRKKTKKQKKELAQQTVLGTKHNDANQPGDTIVSKPVGKLIRLNLDDPVHKRVLIQWKDWKAQGKSPSAELIKAADIGMNITNPVHGAKYLEKHHPELVENLVTKSRAELQKRITEQDNTIAMMQAAIAMLCDKIEEIECNQVGMMPTVKRVGGLLRQYDMRNSGIVIASKQTNMVGSGE